MRNDVITLGAASLLLFGLGGCNSATGPELFPAGGTVKYKEQPVSGATVTFMFSNGLNAVGDTDANGKFKLTTNGHEGAPAGSAKVAVVKTSGAGAPASASTPEDMAKGGMAKMMAERGKVGEKKKAASTENEIPKIYASPETSKLTAEVKSSGTNDFPLDLE